MKRFAYTLLRFSLLPLVVWLLLEGTIAVQKQRLLSEEKLEKVFRHSGDNYQWVSSIQHPAKILLLGSSTVKYGLNCRLLDQLSEDSLSFMNLAANARDPIESYFILRQIDLAHVKAVYMGLDPWIYTKAYYKSRNGYLYLDMNFLTAARYGLKMDPKTLAGRYKGLVESFLPAAGKKTGTTEVPAGLGSGVLDRKPVNFNDSVHNKFKLDAYGWSELQFEYLQKIAAFCESRHISFFVFYPPKRSDFIADYKNYCSSIHTAFLDQLKRTGFHAPVLGSFEQLQPGGDSLFADAYHLNAKGQDRYSRVFFEMITGKSP